MQSLLRSKLNITSLPALLRFLGPRRLSDTYHDSLVYTNLLLISLFGNAERYVPAHMPHLINKAVLAKIEQRIAAQFANTMSHRFRSSDDLQFAFMYFYFLRHFEQEKEDQYYDSLWDRFLDMDHNGVLDPNEFRTLASVVFDNKVTPEFPRFHGLRDRNLADLLECVAPEKTTEESYTVAGKTVQTVTKTRDAITYPISAGTLPSRRFARYKQCARAVKAMANAFPFSAKFRMAMDDPVAFQMLDDDFNSTLRQVGAENRVESSSTACGKDSPSSSA